MSHNRNTTIDVAKGLGICLVVYGHMMLVRSPYIYSFHMPLFVLISGFLFTPSPLTDFTRRKVKHLLIPMAFFNVCYIIVDVIEGTWGGGGNCINSIYLLGQVPNGGPLWFLWALFATLIIYRVMVVKLTDKEMHLTILFVFVVNAILAYLSKQLPFNMSTILGFLYIFHIGYCIKLYDLSRIFRPNLLIIICVLFVWIFSVEFNKQYLPDSNPAHVDNVMMYRNKIGNPFLFCMGFMAGSYILFFVAQTLRNCRLLVLLGRHSLAIMALHYPIVVLIREKVADNILLVIVTSVVEIIICLFLSIALQKYAPLLVGMKKN